MAKIAIFEDDINDLVRRYNDLVRDNEVHVYLTDFIIPNASLLERVLDFLEKKGFRRENIHPNYGKKDSGVNFSHAEVVDADFYFLDGLQGYCFLEMEYYKLPVDKCYIVSDNYLIHDSAIHDIALEKRIKVVTLAEVSELVKKPS